ncbi:MAG: fluoride efflux transporter CrcB [Bacteroidota bacterium]
MTAFLWVLLGGALGSGLRFSLSRLFPFNAAESFPWSTFFVNLMGCLLIGILVGLIDRRPAETEVIKWFWISGFCGGFTTFSAFSMETISLVQHDRWPVAIGYTVSSVLLGIFVTWGGWQWIRS